MNEDDPLRELIGLRQSLKARVTTLRQEAELLLAKAGALEVAEVDLDIAIGAAQAAIAARSEGCAQPLPGDNQ